jgi:hypothetical protein
MMHNVVVDDASMPPRYVVDAYRRAFKSAYGKEPAARYAGNYWYFINNEAVHHATLIQEIARLRDMSQKQTLLNADKSVIHKLISRLRGL